jgi:DNA mismatch repair protein MutS2
VQADQSEGRLGLELMRIRKVFETSGNNALILMDELCSGTNPSEGERIFEMVLDLLEELGARVWITTHFLDFAQRLEQKKLAAQAPGEDTAGARGGPRLSAQSLAFLQVELDATKRPTYQFIPGVAETSLARNTAARLGVTREELRGLISAHAGPVRPT